MTIDAAVRTATRPLRRALRALASADPDGSQLRRAFTTVVTLTVIATVLFLSAGLAGLPASAVSPGIIVGMIASTTVREPRPVPRAITIALLAPAAFVSVSLASAVSGAPLVSDAIFVAVAAGAVCLRAFGARGTSIGMVAFMSYFVALFTGTKPADLPVVAIALVISAGLTIAVRQLFGRAHPAHDLRRMLRALGDRAYRVVEALEEGVTDGEFDDRLRRTIRSRLAACGTTASAVEGRLESATEMVVPGISEEELGTRVFDFQLSLEHLVESVRKFLSPTNSNPPTIADRTALAKDLQSFGVVVRGPVSLDRPDTANSHNPEMDNPKPINPAALARLDRTLAVGTEAWRRVASRGPDSSEDLPSVSGGAAAALSGGPSVESEGKEEDSALRRSQIRTVSRQAVQVAVAATLAIAAGTAISSRYWYWAVIAAFIIYVGASSRGEILTKGWLRIVGTIGGVVFGVVVASLVGGNTVLAIVLIAVCLFLSVYLTPLSSAFTILFVTIMLALLYGLLGVFSIELLLTRLTETGAGAAIGVGVAYVILPTGTRDVTRQRMRAFLGSLSSALTSATDMLGAGPASQPKVLLTSGRQLRNSFDKLSTAIQPLTQGVAGLPERSGSRRTMQLVAACERRGRTLLRLADHSPGIADSEPLGRLLEQASKAVRSNIENMSGAIGGEYGDVTMTSAESLLDAFEDQIDKTSSDKTVLVIASRDLRDIDLAICTRATELGATIRATDLG